MPHRRRIQKGSFAAHFDELVMHFPHEEAEKTANGPHKRAERLQEKLDIHALLFERAWRIEDPR